MLSESQTSLQPLAQKRMVIRGIIEDATKKIEEGNVLIVLEGESSALSLYINKEDVGKYTFGDVLDIYVYSLPLIKSK